MRMCAMCGKKPAVGSAVTHRGMLKKKGGVGRRTVRVNKRRFLPNLQHVRAIINGRTLSVGQELDGYRVTSISPDHVSLTDGNHTLELSIAH